MRPLFITASTVVSAIGRGAEATLAALRDRASGLRAVRLRRVTGGHIGRVDGRRGTTAAARAGRASTAATTGWPTWRCAPTASPTRSPPRGARYGAARIAVVVGTSTSGILASRGGLPPRATRRRGALPADFDYAHTHDMFSLARFVRAALGLRGPALVVSTACASSAKAFADARAADRRPACATRRWSAAPTRLPHDAARLRARWS